MAAKPKLRFEVIADIDVDGAVFQVGLQHYPIGPARPAMLINAGAVEVTINVHHDDLDSMLDALKEARKRLKKFGAPS